MPDDHVRAEQTSSRRTAAAVALSVLGVATVAVAQPLLDLVGRNSAFLVAHDVGRLDLLALTAAVAFGGPLLLAGLVVAVMAASTRGGEVLHDAVLAVLIAAAVMVVLRVSGLGGSLPAIVELTAAGAIGAGAALVYDRVAAMRSVTSYAAVLAPVVAAFFLLATPARGVLLPAAASASATTLSGPTPPIVMVVFDELPLATLLNEGHVVDGEAFPAFAALARESTFFRNTTASHSSTVEAVPSLLTGRYVPVNTLPNAAGHPANLFSVLGSTYRAHSLEPLTDLCAVTGCSKAVGEPSGNDYMGLASDLAVLQLHLLAPDDWTSALPPVDAGWRDFGTDAGLDRGAFLTDAKRTLRQDTAGEFRRYVREIRQPQQPTLHVLHTLLPHRPWRHLPDGRRHGGTSETSLTQTGWTSRAWPVHQSHQLHLAQARFADLLLGELMARLKQTGQYDDALVVVVADHGLSLLPGTPPRDVTADTLEQIAPVPFFLKQPGQTTAQVSDEPLETVDVMPTVLDLIDAAPPDGLDGVSALSARTRTERRMIDADGRTWDVSVSADALSAGVRRKLALFPRADDLYRATPAGHADLLGRRLPTVSPTPAPLRVSLKRAGMYERVEPRSAAVPALVEGEVHGLESDASAPVLAIAVNGTIAAVTRAEAGQGPPGPFRALVPPAQLRPGRNEIAVLLVRAGQPLAEIPRSSPP